ncbi:MAG: isopeptide-forming domain-containing fimbrial protein [Chordicoccus sp.]
MAMKKMAKTVMTVLLAAVMMLAMTVCAFADDTASHNISVKNNTNGNTYSVYQIMTATKIGDNLYSYTLNSAFEGFFKDGANGYKLTENNEIQTSAGTAVTGDSRWLNTNTTEAARLAAALEKYALAKGITAAGTLKDTSAQSFADGYYVVAETASGTTDQTEVASKPVLVNLVGSDAEITAKNDQTTLTKVIGTDTNTGVKANSVNIGDKVPYVISTKIPTYEANVDTTKLYFTLTDTFSQGLTYNNDLTIDGFTRDTDYTVATSTDNKETVLTITFKQEAINKNQGQPVVATYSATLNENAKVYSANPNYVKLEYTNNTNVENGHKTLTDETKTYTFGFGIEKVDKATNKPLDGAVFTLKDKDGNEIRLVQENDTVYRVAKSDDKTTTTDITVNSKKDGSPVIKGLNEDTYTLVEKTAPDSYSKVSPITVVVTAVKDKNNALTGAATIAVSGGTTEVKSGDTITDTTVTNEANGKISINVYVKDTKGISLPETGSRTAMYCLILGAALVAAGAVVFGLASRKKAQ